MDLSTIQISPWAQLGLYFGTGILGLAAHWLKTKVKGQHLDDIVSYFKNYPKEAILSVIALVVLLGVANQTEGLTYLTAFAAGYSCDSLFSRADKGGNEPPTNE